MATLVKVRHAKDGEVEVHYTVDAREMMRKDPDWTFVERLPRRSRKAEVTGERGASGTVEGPRVVDTANSDPALGGKPPGSGPEITQGRGSGADPRNPLADMGDVDSQVQEGKGGRGGGPRTPPKAK